MLTHCIMNLRLSPLLIAGILLGAACDKTPQGNDYREADLSNRKDVLEAAYIALSKNDKPLFLSLLSADLQKKIVEPKKDGRSLYDDLVAAAIAAASNPARQGIERLAVSDDVQEKTNTEFLPSFEFIDDLRFSHPTDSNQDIGFRIKMKSVPVSEEVYMKRAKEFMNNVPIGTPDFVQDKTIAIAVDYWEISELTPLAAAPVGPLLGRLAFEFEGYISSFIEAADSDGGYRRFLDVLSPELQAQFVPDSKILESLNIDLGLNSNGAFDPKIFEEAFVRNPLIEDAKDKSFGDKALSFELVNVYFRKDSLDFSERVVKVEVSIPNNKDSQIVSVTDVGADIAEHGFRDRRVQISDYKLMSPPEAGVIDQLHFEEGQREAIEDIKKFNLFQKQLRDEEAKREKARFSI